MDGSPRPLFILRYLQQPQLRRRVSCQLNKVESLQGLRDTVSFGYHGNIRHRQLADQAAQALCLTLVVNCIAAYNAELFGDAVGRLRAAGFQIDDADVSHLGPTMTEHLNVHGRYRFELDGAPKGLRPVPPPVPQTIAH
jgi:hypothetical protein